MGEPLAFTIHGPIVRSDLPGLCARVCVLLTESGATEAEVDVSGVERDAATVEALARLQLAAKRQSCRITLTNASDELCQLVAFMGLKDVLTTRDAAAGRTGGRSSRSPGRT